MQISHIRGDITQQTDVDVLVNAWNRNVIPWWLLLPQGVSGALKRTAGTRPFQELGYRPLPLGEARLTSAGNLPNKAIIHVAGIDMLWRATESSIRNSVVSAVRMTVHEGFDSMAIPIIGAGSGSFDENTAAALIAHTLTQLDHENAAPNDLVVRLVHYAPAQIRGR